jgi:hypothetical protein
MYQHARCKSKDHQHKMFETCRRRRVCYLVTEQHLQMLRRLKKGAISRCLHLPATGITKSCVTSWSNNWHSFYWSEYSNWNIATAAWQTRKKRQDTAGLWTEAGEKIWGLRREASSVMATAIERKYYRADSDERCETLAIKWPVKTKRMHNSGQERAWK